MDTFHVLEIFNLPSREGDAIRIKLSKNLTIKPGQRISNNNGKQWIVKGIISNMIYSDSTLNQNEFALEDFQKSIWNCLVVPVNHNEKINEGDLMYLL